MDELKEKALKSALTTIERQYGKGSIMRLGDGGALCQGIDVVSTGSIGLDQALGIGTTAASRRVYQPARPVAQDLAIRARRGISGGSRTAGALPRQDIPRQSHGQRHRAQRNCLRQSFGRRHCRQTGSRNRGVGSVDERLDVLGNASSRHTAMGGNRLSTHEGPSLASRCCASALNRHRQRRTPRT